MLATMMIPPQVTMIPGFLIYRSLGWYNTLLPLWVGASFGAPFFTPALAGSKLFASLMRDQSKTTLIRITFSEPIGTGFPKQSLGGKNGVLFFAYDIDGSGKTGDAPGERGSTATPYSLDIQEVDPPGPPGLSGYSRYWTFQLPKDSKGTPLPGGTPLDLDFDKAILKVKRLDDSKVKSQYNHTVPN